MSDFKLVGNELDITNFDFSLVESSNEILQRIILRLNTYRGELFYNTRYGVPYYQEIFGKNRSVTVIENSIKSEILGVEGVKKLLEFSLDYEGNRSIRINALIQIYTDEELIIDEVL